MKLLRYGSIGQERPGVLDKHGAIRDLSGIISDIDGATLSSGALDVLKHIDLTTLPRICHSVRLGPPITNVRQMIAIALNYKAHAEEGGFPIPEEPVYFMKAVSAITGPNDPIVIPKNAQKVDWEAELAFVIGKRATYIEKENALDHVAGYLIAHDVSERTFQIERGTQWTKGKSCQSFAPLGPWLVTKDEISTPHDLNIRLDVNNERMQTASTNDMIFDIPSIIACLSRYMILDPGDVILTGTPSGVGFGKSPPQYLTPGDIVDIEIGGLGVQRQHVAAHAAS